MSIYERGCDRDLTSRLTIFMCPTGGDAVSRTGRKEPLADFDREGGAEDHSVAWASD